MAQSARGFWCIIALAALVALAAPISALQQSDIDEFNELELQVHKASSPQDMQGLLTQLLTMAGNFKCAPDIIARILALLEEIEESIRNSIASDEALLAKLKGKFEVEAARIRESVDRLEVRYSVARKQYEQSVPVWNKELELVRKMKGHLAKMKKGNFNLHDNQESLAGIMELADKI